MWTVSTLGYPALRDHGGVPPRQPAGRARGDRAGDGARVGPGRGRPARGGPTGGRLAQRGVPPLRRPRGAASPRSPTGAWTCSPRRWSARLAAMPEDLDDLARAQRRLQEVGRAYVEFALAEPGLFRTAFATQEHDAVGRPPTARRRATRRGRTPLLNTILDELVEVGYLSAERRPGADVVCWAGVHGVRRAAPRRAARPGAGGGAGGRDGPVLRHRRARAGPGPALVGRQPPISGPGDVTAVRSRHRRCRRSTGFR